MKTRVLLADDHQLVLDGLTSLLEREPGFDVVGCATSGPQAVAMSAELDPDVIIMDLSMPGMPGTEATQRIKRERPTARIICLSMHDQEPFVAAAMRAGASAYILKDRVVEEVLKGLEAVLNGEIYLCDEIAKMMGKARRSSASD